MLRITCPFCGPRDHAEFLYGGDAEQARPPEDNADPARWHRHVFIRSNPRGPHHEYWQHIHGCRLWLRVTRDTSDHTVEATVVAGRDSPIDGPPAPADSGDSDS